MKAVEAIALPLMDLPDRWLSWAMVSTACCLTAARLSTFLYTGTISRLRKVLALGNARKSACSVPCSVACSQVAVVATCSVNSVLPAVSCSASSRRSAVRAVDDISHVANVGHQMFPVFWCFQIDADEDPCVCDAFALRCGGDRRIIIDDLELDNFSVFSII